MTTQELERYLLSLEPAEKLRIIQILTQSLIADTAIGPLNSPQPTQKLTLASVISTFRNTMLAEGIEINPDEIWGNARDRTPVSEAIRHALR
jgi:hypothetical protein